MSSDSGRSFFCFRWWWSAGLGTIPGALIGVALLGLLPEIMRTTMRGLLIWQEFAYGLVLILVVMFMPRGIWGMIASRRERSR